MRRRKSDEHSLLTSPAIGSTNTGGNNVCSIFESSGESGNQDIIARAATATENTISAKFCIRRYTGKVIWIETGSNDTGNMRAMLVA